MKKITLLLCAFVFVLTSCSNDDDNDSAQDPFIGTWAYYKSFENDVEQELELCETEGTVIISENGTYSSTYFSENEDGNCIQDQDVETGTWENVGNGNYAISYEGEIDTIEVFFEDNTFYLLDSYTFDGETTIYKDVYIRN